MIMMNQKNRILFPDTHRVGIYCRLSKDDELQDESASICNQRDYLTDYCKQQGWEIVAYYADDGFTGLNKDRPDLQRLMDDCEKHLINLVITKDASGRESAEVWGVCHFGRCPSFFIFGKVPQDSAPFLGTQPFRLSECSKGIGAFPNWQKLYVVRTHALIANL